MSGYIYFITNKSMPGLIKIGYTEGTIQERMNSLNTTGVPAPFNLISSFYVHNPLKTETSMHKKLSQYRYNNKKEFFSISFETAISEVIPIVLEDICIQDISDNPRQNDSSLEDGSIFVLQCLSDHKRHVGYAAEDMCDLNAESPIETEYRLATLKELGLVEEKRSGTSYGASLWRITSKGVKYLFDNNHVEGYMIEKT